MIAVDLFSQQLINYIVRLHDNSDHVVLGLSLGVELSAASLQATALNPGSQAVSMVGSAEPPNGLPEMTDQSSVSALMAAIDQETLAASVSSSPSNPALGVAISSSLYPPSVMESVLESLKTYSDAEASGERDRASDMYRVAPAAETTPAPSYQHIHMGKLKSDRPAVLSAVATALERKWAIYCIFFVNMSGRYTACRIDFSLMWRNPQEDLPVIVGATQPTWPFDHIWYNIFFFV